MLLFATLGRSTVSVNLISLLVLAWTSADASPKAPRSFPKDFRFCVATAAHQIEGDNIHSDWWEFERKPDRIKDQQTSGKAIDHWNRLEEDTLLLRELGVQEYRFSIEWAKLEPQEGVWDLEAFRHYRDELNLLRRSNIRAMITLHHFTLPKWFRDLGAWESERAAEIFLRFGDRAYREFGGEVSDWITFNEPMIHLGAGYIYGVVPPEARDSDRLGRALLGLLHAHAKVYHHFHQIARERGWKLRIGMAHHLRVADPKRRWNPLDHWVARQVDWVVSWAIPDALRTGRVSIWIPFTLRVMADIPELKGTQDFFGFNYYSRDLVSLSWKGEPVVEVVPNQKVNDLGWEIYPTGFARVIDRIVKDYRGLPILVTENGIADRTDEKRIPFIYAHLEFLLDAIERGAPIENYCYWTLADNFEWIEGFGPRFGLYEVDHSRKLKRIARPSARWYGRLSRTKELILPSSKF